MDHSLPTRIIAVTSGKGGVGKTNICANLAFALEQAGYRVCIFDADLGLANISILLGLVPAYTLEDVILGHKGLHDILIKDFHGVDIIPGSSGVEKIANLDKSQIQHMAQSFTALNDYHFILIDTSAGIAKSIIAFCMAASELLIIITPEPTSMTDAYALLKILVLNGFKGLVRIIVNQSKNIQQAKKIYTVFRKTVHTYLNVEMSLTGVIVIDSKVVEAVKHQEPFLLRYPDSNASKCILHLAKTLLGRIPDQGLVHDAISIWEKCFNVMKRPLKMNDNKQVVIDQDEFLVEKQEIQTSKDSLKMGPENINLMEMMDLMDKLVNGVENVSEELRQIKESLGNGLLTTPIQKASSTKVLSHSDDNRSFIIDYEAFLSKHNLE